MHDKNNHIACKGILLYNPMINSGSSLYLYMERRWISRILLMVVFSFETFVPNSKGEEKDETQ